MLKIILCQALNKLVNILQKKTIFLFLGQIFKTQFQLGMFFSDVIAYLFDFLQIWQIFADLDFTLLYFEEDHLNLLLYYKWIVTYKRLQKDKFYRLSFSLLKIWK